MTDPLDVAEYGLPKYAKVYALGDPRLHGLLKGEVEITEKVDGSQCRFGKFNGRVCFGSKEVNYFEGQTPDKLFEPAFLYVHSLEPQLPPSIAFFCETLAKPTQNTVQYERVPLNHLMLFGVANFGEEPRVVGSVELLQGKAATPAELQVIARSLGLEPPNVLLIADGETFTRAKFYEIVTTTTSFLGKALIEGVVIKNYSKPSADPNHFSAVMAGKFVRDSFKEEHAQRWSTSKDILGQMVERFTTTARWEKAVAHVRDNGKLDGSMRDMVPLLAQIADDIDTEIKEMALEMLWKHYRDNLLRGVRSGFPEWYKKRLADAQFAEGKVDG